MVNNVSTGKFSIIQANTETSSSGIVQYLIVNNGGTLQMQVSTYPQPINPVAPTFEPLSNYFTIDNVNQTCSYSFNVELLRSTNTIGDPLIDTSIVVEQRDVNNNITKIQSNFITYDPNYTPINSSLCSSSDAQNNGYSTSNISGTTGIVVAGDTSNCSVQCSNGFYLKDKTCVSTPTESSLATLRLGGIYNYSKGSPNLRGSVTGDESDFFSRMDSAKITDAGLPDLKHPVFIDRFNYIEKNFPDGNDYPFYFDGNGDALLNETYITFDLTYTNDTVAGNDMQKFFSVDSITGITYDGLHSFYGVMYKGGRCFILGQMDQSLSFGDNDQIAAISVFDYGPGAYVNPSPGSTPASSQNITLSQCQDVKNLFADAFSQYYDLVPGKIYSSDNINLTNHKSWIAKLDLRIDAQNLAYDSGALSSLQKFNDLKLMFEELGLGTHALDPNDTNGAFHYLNFKPGMYSGGDLVEGILGMVKDNTTEACSLNLKVNSQGSVQYPFKLKTGESTDNPCGASTLETIRDSMGLTSSDVVVESIVQNGSTYYYFEEVISAPIAANPFYPYRNTWLPDFDVDDSNMILYPEMQMYVPGVGDNPANALAGGTFTGQLGVTYNFGNYITLARTDNSRFNWPNHHGFYIFKYSNNIVVDYFLSYTILTESGIYSGPVTYNSSFMGGAPSGPTPIPNGEAWQLIANYNHALKIVKGIIPENTPYPTGITSQTLLSSYLSSDSNAQLTEQSTLGFQGQYDELFYSINP